MPSGHQVIRGVNWYRSCTSQGTEVDLFLHGPGHLFSVAFGLLHSSELIHDIPFPAYCMRYRCQCIMDLPYCGLTVH